MKKRKKKSLKIEKIIVDESLALHKKKGNGVLRRQIWCDDEFRVTRYSLAYINHHIFSGDNGRVVGYDNAHGYHHKHCMGIVEPVAFSTFKEIEEIFQREFEVMHEKHRKK